VDYRRFASQAVLDTPRRFAPPVRPPPAAKRPAAPPTGTFMELAAHNRGSSRAAHLALTQALQTKALDFLVGPPGDVAPGALLIAHTSLAWAHKAYLPASRPRRIDPLEAPPPRAWSSAASAYGGAGSLVRDHAGTATRLRRDRRHRG